MTIRNAGWALLVLLLATTLSAGCGVSGSSGAPGFQIAGVGPGGGVVAAGDVVLTIAAGALPSTTAVSVLPQATPFPIQKAGNDPCTYTYLGPLWCCGPVGMDLNQPSVLRVYYDESLIPAGFTETDLVLFRWNNALGVMEPNFSTTQNTTLNYFEDTNHIQLGHTAVGVRDCSQVAGNIVVAGNQAGGGGAITDGMYIVNIDGAPAPAFISGELPFQFVPSPDGTRVLLSLPDDSESLVLGTIPITGGATTTVANNSDGVDLGDPFFGWLTQLSGRVFFTQFRPSSMNTKPTQIVDPGQDQSVFVHGPGTANGPFTAIHGISLSQATISDYRQSPDGAHLLIRYEDSMQTSGGSQIDIVETSTGAYASNALVPAGGGQHTPRFTSTSTQVYVVSSSQQMVTLYDLDGTPGDTIYSFGPGEVVQTIQDAVLNRDDTLMAVIIRGISTDTLQLVVPNPQTGGTVAETLDLGDQPIYEDVFWNPTTNVVYIATRGNVRAFSMDPTAAVGSRIVDHGNLPTSGIRNLDIDRVSGELVHLVFGQSIGVGDNITKPGDASTQTIGGGLCVSDPTGGNIRNLSPFGLNIYGARWVNSFRRAPGFNGQRIR